MHPYSLSSLALLGMTAALAWSQPIPDGGGDIRGTPYVVPTAGPSVGQFVVPSEAVKSGPPLPSAPPAPAITMLVLVPQDASPNSPLPYEIRVTNNSTADAGKVKVRMPMPEGMTFVSAVPDAVKNEAGDMVWDLKSIPHNETRKIELKLKAGPAVTEVNAKAYVNYEFGQTVKTRLSAQKLKVSTELPKLITSADEAITVRVRVANDGKVPVQAVKLTETISEGFEFHRDADGDKTGSPLTRTWNLGSIAGGMGKVIEFQVIPKTGKELLVRSNLDAAGGLQHSDDAKAAVKDVKLKVELRGDPQAIDDTATFKMVVKNEGTIALANVRVIGTVPDESRVTSRTNGGQLYQGQVQWLIAKLPPGESYSYKWTIQSKRAGRKSVKGEAASGSLRDSQEVQTVFAGTAALTWEQKFDSATVPVDKSGLFTVKVANNGSETAKAVKLTLTLPPEVSFVQASPRHVKEGNVLVFDARDVKAGGSDTFSVTFRGDRTGPAYFTAKLTGDTLGDKPMTSEKYVQIVSGR